MGNVLRAPGGNRAFLDARRWYTVDCYASRDKALEVARKHRRTEAFGRGRAYRVRHSSDTGRWCVEHGSPLSESDRKHAAHYNRRMIEDEKHQRRLGL